MTDHNYDPDEMSDDELHDTVIACVNELLNIASGVADLQTTDLAAEEMYQMCDLVAAYFNIKRMHTVVEQNPDGSYTTRLVDPDEHDSVEGALPQTIPGVIRTTGKHNYRVVDDRDGKRPK